jgi:predicted deacylase
MNRNTDPITKYTLKSLQEGPHVVLLAGVHGDEYEPMVAASELIRLLEGQLLKGIVSVVPQSNPRAYQTASRYGDDGLDMARICPGNPDGSSSEKAAHEVSALIRSADYLVDMHTGGILYDIYPLAGYMLHSDASVLARQQQMALCYDLPVVWGTEASPEGRTLSVARDAGIPAIYLEYGGGTGFRKQVVEAYIKGFTNLLRHLGMIEGEYVPKPSEKTYWVEDHRNNSGFLQGKMPSPADGIFMASANMGDLLRKGDHWGTLFNPLTNGTTDVLADMDGLAFLIRNVVKVNEGDALGGILPITQPGKVTIPS